MCNTCGNIAHDDLDDDLPLFLEGVGTEAHILATFRVSDEQFRKDFDLSGERKPGYNAAEDKMIEDTLYWEPCKKCRGSGRFIRGSFNGECYACKGKGKFSFKTSPEDRAKAKQAKDDRAQREITEWAEANRAAYDWMTSAAVRGFRFAVSMVEALNKYHYLTERQLEAVEKCMAQDLDRDKTREQQKAAAKTVDVSVIEESFAFAMNRGVKSPKLRLDGFKFSRAPDHSANAGAIYVKDIESDDYLGKIVGGKFLKVRACTDAQEARIIAAAADPKAAAIAYGQRTGTCSVCGRLLTAAESVDAMIGPICAGNYGW